MPPMKLKPRSKQKNISDFSARCGTKSTGKAYRNGVINFLNFLYGIEETRRATTGPDIYNLPPDMEFYDRLSLQYLNEPDRDYAEDLLEFITSHRDSPGTTRAGWKTAVTQWLAANKIFLHPQETRTIRAPRVPHTQDVIPTPADLRALMDHSDLQMGTLIMVLSSSGMRAGEALQLRWSDIDLETGLIRIRGEITKTQTPRITYVSTEAIESLKKWEGYYGKYVKGKRTRRKEFKESGNDERLIFPISYSAARGKFALSLKKAGLDERCGSTGRHRIHFHALRKYFRTRLPQGGCSVDVVELLMGHQGYLTASYLRLTADEVEQQYRAGEHALWVYRSPPINIDELRRVEAENAELRAALEHLQADVRAVSTAQAMTGGYLDSLLQDPQANADKLRRLKELLLDS